MDRTKSLMSEHESIQSIDELAEPLRNARAESKVIVHCHGVFDLLHIGHIRYLQRAKQMGDVLVVTVTPDRFVNRGPHRPAFEEQLRLDAVAALKCVDYAVLNQWPTGTEAIQLLQPHIYAKGGEFKDRKTPELLQEEAAAEAVGARVVFIDEPVTSSSSRLINDHFTLFDERTAQYLEALKRNRTTEEILQFVQPRGAPSVLVVGEAIVDEYYNCSTLGRSSKAPIVSTQYDSHERFAGGALAVANHLADFSEKVGLISMIGQRDSEEAWIRERLRDNVEPTFLSKHDSPTIVKRWYREAYFGIPLFEINFLNDMPLSATQSDQLCTMLGDTIREYDAVIVADYGHSMLGPEAIEILCSKSRFLAVNTQANAANGGFHTISKYSRADYVSLAEHEIELECRSRTENLERMAESVRQRLEARTVAVTLGSRGCFCCDRNADAREFPGLATKVVDRIGGGDAFFAISALCAAQESPLDILAFLGNVAGAEAVATIGNSRFLQALPFQRHIESLLK